MIEVGDSVRYRNKVYTVKAIVKGYKPKALLKERKGEYNLDDLTLTKKQKFKNELAQALYEAGIEPEMLVRYDVGDLIGKGKTYGGSK